MTDEDPVRLAAGEDSPIKRLIEEGRKELASPTQLGAVAAKLGPVLGGGGGGPTGGGGGGANAPRPASVTAPKAAGMGLANQLAIGALGLATLVTIVRVAMTQGTSAVPLTSTPEGPLPGGSSSAEPANSGPDPADPLLTPPDPSTFFPVPHHGEGGVAAPLAAKSGPNPGTELHLLMQAQDALAAEPAKTLELCNEHSKRFAASKFAQDREVLAITALVALDRTDEARKRSDAFRATYPGSPLVRRIDQILPSP
jgi:hypothetical protein